MAKNDQHVVPNKDGRWAVRGTGALKASRVFNVQEDAISYAKELAKKQHSELYVHSKDGTIRSKSSYGSTSVPYKYKR